MILVSAEQWACLSSFCPFILFLAPSSFNSFSAFSFVVPVCSTFLFLFGFRRQGKLRLSRKIWDSAFVGQTQKKARIRSDGINVILCFSCTIN
ncbi:hypothetical protein HDV57DRAFT_207358 [Trichoderma longibrachiatum]|uniref:Uncharacterized protein n=1 Tax=Trichoderma longibrachiatum ATCC 18648 TaxID=983965 RepID=A0A2T4C805_TRILO|nr:hypothetical protein M440DRAFT_1221827 [Trichoderma longibrachiatum ATCC 18648]